MTFKRALLPLYAIATISLLAINTNGFAMQAEEDAKNQEKVGGVRKENQEENNNGNVQPNNAPAAKEPEIKDAPVVPEVEKAVNNAQPNNAPAAKEPEVKAGPAAPKVEKAANNAQPNEAPAAKEQEVKAAPVVPEVEKAANNAQPNEVPAAKEQEVKAAPVVPEVEKAANNAQPNEVPATKEQEVKAGPAAPKVENAAPAPQAAANNNDQQKNNAKVEASSKEQKDSAAGKQSTERPNAKLTFDFKKLVNSPSKKMLLAFFAAFGRLVTKDEPTPNPLGLKDGLEGFVKKNPFSKEYLQHFVKFIDDVIIGFAGKKRGFFQVGASRIGYDGQQQHAATIKQQTANGTEEIIISKYGNAYPYGLMGWIWAYTLGIFKGFDGLKKNTEAAQWTHNFVNDNLSKPENVSNPVATAPAA